MTLTESIVEDAALAMPKAALTPALSQKERESRETIRRLNPALIGSSFSTRMPNPF